LLICIDANLQRLYKVQPKMLDVMRYCVNFNALSLKELDKNKEFKSNSIVAKDNVTFNEKTS